MISAHIHIQKTVRAVRCVCVAVVAIVLATSAHAWDITKISDREYVTIDNVSDFYRFQSRQISGKKIHLRSASRSLQGEVDSRELLINNVKFILSHPIVEHNDELLISRMDLSKLIEPILRPNRIPGAGNLRTVVLDAGHGGHDRGARGIWGWEKDFNLDVARRARELLVRAGYKVEMTRSTDVFIPLHERAAFANKHKDGIFVSIHFNSSNNREASGVETFVLAPRGVPSFAQDGPRVSDFVQCKGNARDAENIALATAMHSAKLRRLKLPDRGVKRARFVVIRDIEIPGVLLEGGFLSNPNDCRHVATTSFRQQMAMAILDAVTNYQSAISGGRPPGVRDHGHTASSGASVTIRPLDENSPTVVIGTEGEAEKPEQ